METEELKKILDKASKLAPKGAIELTAKYIGCTQANFYNIKNKTSNRGIIINAIKMLEKASKKIVNDHNKKLEKLDNLLKSVA